ncbi:MAG: hypothetical protein CL398_08755 [Acidiferrobacteraceae bacterium]|nr:hypothetical protein [Acidiferrobacteraceae bacterium]|tara:strand:- start:414 stop:1382 length:969 start_codon:yes stop_codon:yes gene_type:complete
MVDQTSILDSLNFPVALVDLDSQQLIFINRAFCFLSDIFVDGSEAPDLGDLDKFFDGRLSNLLKTKDMCLVKEIASDQAAMTFYEFTLRLSSDSDSTAILIGFDKSDLNEARTSIDAHLMTIEEQSKDIALIEQRNKELYRLAHTDSLTGVANRRALFRQFKAIATTSKDFHCIVSILDIDHFKVYNDQYGHEFGDFVLRTFARQVRGQIAEDSIIARLGGEEFCVVDFHNTRSSATERLETALDIVKDLQLKTPKVDSVNISFSAGVAEYAVDGLTLDELLRNADKALYFAKANGRSCVIPYSADLFEKRDMTLIAKLHGT